MIEKTCYLCHDNNVEVTPFHTDFPRGAAHLVKCKACGKYAISQAITESVKADSQEKRTKLQQQVYVLKAPLGQLAFIDQNSSNVIAARLVKDLPSQQ